MHFSQESEVTQRKTKQADTKIGCCCQTLRFISWFEAPPIVLIYLIALIIEQHFNIITKSAQKSAPAQRTYAASFKCQLNPFFLTI